LLLPLLLCAFAGNFFVLRIYLPQIRQGRQGKKRDVKAGLIKSICVEAL
jgi:hypothetical protein